MIKNYIKIAFRNIKKHKVYSLINILGLAVGISVCMLIFQYVSNELSYDKYHSKSDRIYRITLDHPRDYLAVTPSMMLPALKKLFPEVETGVRLYDAGKVQPLIVSYEDKVFEENKIVYADSTLLNVFEFKLLEGDASSILNEPFTILLTKETAFKYFGKSNAIGKNIEINNRDFQVTGVIENIPENSHFRYDFFASMISRSGWSELNDNTWRSANFYTYIVLKDGSNVAELKRKVDNYIKENFSENEFVAVLDITFQPLTDIHLYSEINDDIAPQGDIQYVLSASAIALLIIIIACINYMNLATARSTQRAREVGIRKVMGSGRGSLIRQFYGESTFLVLLSIGVSILLIEFFTPWFNQIIGQNLTVDYSTFLFWGVILGIGLLITLIAGSYPALMLSSFVPTSVLKGTTVQGGNASLRKTLVVFQFTASIFLIISTLIIYRQINFVQKKELGYQKENVLVLTAYRDVENQYETFKSNLSQIPGVKGAALSSETPTTIRAGYSPDIADIEEGSNFVSTALRVNQDFISAMNIDLVAGRNFTDGEYNRANNSEEREYALLINEATATYFGLNPEELIGKTATIGGSSGIIVGVVKDFHFSSLHKPIEPLFIFPRGGFNKLLISFNTSNLSQTLNATKSMWKQMFPQYPFEYQFLDQEYDALYQQEVRAGNIFTSFAVLAIFIACLGLVGLASYMVERKTREIGVRKVLGASVIQIITLFSKDFMILVLIGFFIAVPIAWYTMSVWLQNFSYRTDIHWTVILLAGFFTLIVAFLTVSYQALKAANLDPVKSIKSE